MRLNTEPLSVKELLAVINVLNMDGKVHASVTAGVNSSSPEEVITLSKALNF